MLQLFWIVLALGAALLAAYFRDWLPYLVGGTIVSALALWVIVSTLWPSRPNRKCPKCSREGLVKIRRGRPGVRCELCDFRDEALHVAYLDDW